MRRLMLSLVLVMSGLSGVAAADVNKLQGVWRPVKLERNGELVRDAFHPEASFVVAADFLLLKVGDTTLQKVRLTLVPGTKPTAVNLTSVSGPTRGETVHGIYRLDGKRLTFCWPLKKGQKRPVTFGQKGSGDVATLTLERVPGELSAR